MREGSKLKATADTALVELAKAKREGLTSDEVAQAAGVTRRAVGDALLKLWAGQQVARRYEYVVGAGVPVGRWRYFLPPYAPPDTGFALERRA